MSALLSRQRARRTLWEATDPAILSLLFVLLQRLSAAHRLYLPPDSEPYHVDPKPLLLAPQPYSGNNEANSAIATRHRFIMPPHNGAAIDRVLLIRLFVIAIQ